MESSTSLTVYMYTSSLLTHSTTNRVRVLVCKGRERRTLRSYSTPRENYMYAHVEGGDCTCTISLNFVYTPVYYYLYIQCTSLPRCVLYLYIHSYIPVPVVVHVVQYKFLAYKRFIIIYFIHTCIVALIDKHECMRGVYFSF